MTADITRISNDTISSVFRNAVYLYLPFLQKDTRQAEHSSLMNGALPGTEQWNEIYDLSDDLTLEWQKFRRRHEIAIERASLLREFLGNEPMDLVQNGETIPISLLRPEIKLSGCVGRSMHGSRICFMDIVASYPVTNPITIEAINLLGSGVDDPSIKGQKIYHEFTIDIGDGVHLLPNSVVELNYLESVIAQASKSCPREYSTWMEGLHKIRHIDCVKISANDDVSVGVSNNRNGRQEGSDHPISNIHGRVFNRFERTSYEMRLQNSGVWKQLSVGAQYPDLLRPDFQWDKNFPSISEDVQGTLMKALMGDEALREEALLLLKKMTANKELEKQGIIPEASLHLTG